MDFTGIHAWVSALLVSDHSSLLQGIKTSATAATQDPITTGLSWLWWIWIHILSNQLAQLVLMSWLLVVIVITLYKTLVIWLKVVLIVMWISMGLYLVTFNQILFSIFGIVSYIAWDQLGKYLIPKTELKGASGTIEIRAARVVSAHPLPRQTEINEHYGPVLRKRPQTQYTKEYHDQDE